MGPFDEIQETLGRYNVSDLSRSGNKRTVNDLDWSDTVMLNNVDSDAHHQFLTRLSRPFSDTAEPCSSSLWLDPSHNNEGGIDTPKLFAQRFYSMQKNLEDSMLKSQKPRKSLTLAPALPSAADAGNNTNRSSSSKTCATDSPPTLVFLLGHDEAVRRTSVISGVVHQCKNRAINCCRLQRLLPIKWPFATFGACQELA